MRILLAESDKAVAQNIEMMLKSESFNVYTTNHGGEAVDLGKLYDYDAILLGDTPDLTGCDMLKSLRVAKVNSPIIVFGCVSIEHIVQALDAGADDYAVLPVNNRELVARIHAIVRRSKGHTQSVIQTGNLSVNITTKTVSVNGQQIHLTGKEYGILELLSLRKGLTISKEMLLNHLYGGMDEPEIKIIDVFICKIRKKLRAVEGHDVETVWGRGYVLRDAAQQSPSLAPELSEMADEKGVGFVPMRIFSDHRRDSIASGKIKAPSLVPEAGQK